VTHYICQLLLNDDTFFVLWHANENNGVTMEKGQLVYARSIPPLLHYSESRNLTIDSNSITEYEYFDFNDIENWLHRPKASINCEYFLNLWNILVDTIASQHNPSLFLDLAEDENGIFIYNKLFWGANLPDYTPPGKIHIPDWQAEDIASMQTLFKIGLKELRDIIQNGMEMR
jgi:hypothetical protein